ncbi:MBL fold metallo-hydrolase [Desulfolithobacter dissulfuricans]|uniref:MBL fold metallo-hydrolase n=1 Tax=Desulfolithobacter dissulfuricans TaxID=2795293 RepID=UPI00227919CA|nr:MBL fold metallo-hydrolase [Desulfolithobacter dissulfuricans]
MPYKLTHLGAKTTVTGSCHLLQINNTSILVDCGLAQGDDHTLPMSQWPVPPKDIDYLFITHAHLDHCGRLPELIQQGFQGEIITTHATRELLFPMLKDAMALQHEDEESKQHFFTRLDDLTWGFEYNETFELKNKLTFRLGRAGHILGSAFVRLESKEPACSILFSGDLGATNTPLLPDPDPPQPCDHLVLESTYGDRLHEGRHDRIQRLGEILTRALADGGKVFIPVFSLGRTQELLYEIDRLRTDPDLRQQFPLLHSQKIPVVVDSPLGLTLTEIFEQLYPFWDREAQDLRAEGDDPLDFSGLYSARSHRDHQRLTRMDGPAVIIAGSGMCTGGRIVDHLAAGLEDPKNDVLFVGYQAKNTPGCIIQKYANTPDGYVYLDGERFSIRARVQPLSGYSAHTDQQGLLDWVCSTGHKPEKITLVHGEQHARQALAEKLQQRGYQALAS